VTNNLVIPDAAGSRQAICSDLQLFRHWRYNDRAQYQYSQRLGWNGRDGAGSSSGAACLPAIEPGWSLNTSVPSGYNPAVSCDFLSGLLLGGRFLISTRNECHDRCCVSVQCGLQRQMAAGWRALSTTIYWYFTAYTNAGGGYIAKFSSPPEGMISRQPHFADSTRNLVTFDSSYLGTIIRTGRPATATAGRHGDAPDLLVFVVRTSTIAARGPHIGHYLSRSGRYYAPSPNAWVPSGTRGSNWRTYWEPASLYQLRQGVARKPRSRMEQLAVSGAASSTHCATGIHGYTRQIRPSGRGA